MGAFRWVRAIKPWMVALVLVVVGVTGATGIYFAARAQHARDRRAIVPWLNVGAPAITEARRAIEQLDDAERQLRAGRFGIRSEVRIAEEMLRHAAGRLAIASIPKVLDTVAAEITTGLGFAIQQGVILERAALRGVYGVDAQAAYRSAHRSLVQSFDDGVKRLNDIRCRSGLGCTSL